MRQTDESRVLAVLTATPDIPLGRLRTLAVMDRNRCWAAAQRLLDLGIIERRRAAQARTRPPLVYRVKQEKQASQRRIA